MFPVGRGQDAGETSNACSALTSLCLNPKTETSDSGSERAFIWGKRPRVRSALIHYLRLKNLISCCKWVSSQQKSDTAASAQMKTCKHTKNSGKWKTCLSVRLKTSWRKLCVIQYIASHPFLEQCVYGIFEHKLPVTFLSLTSGQRSLEVLRSIGRHGSRTVHYELSVYFIKHINGSLNTTEGERHLDPNHQEEVSYEAGAIRETCCV